jgi:hypothetical protein
MLALTAAISLGSLLETKSGGISGGDDSISTSWRQGWAPLLFFSELVLFRDNSSNNNNRADSSVQKETRRQLLEETVSTARIRIFGPNDKNNDNFLTQQDNEEKDVSLSWYTPDQQRQFLQEHGSRCWPSSLPNDDEEERSALLRRYDEFAATPFLQVEVWKFCMFFTGMGNVFWDPSQMTPLLTWEDMWEDEGSAAAQEKRTALLVTSKCTSSTASSSANNKASALSSWVHPSFLRLDEANAKTFSETMLRLLMETDKTLLQSNPLYTYQALAQQIQNDSKPWRNLWNAQCQVPSAQNPADQVLIQRHHQHQHQQQQPTLQKPSSSSIVQLQQQQRRQLQVERPPEFAQLPTFGWHCHLLGGYCCQVWKNNNYSGNNDAADDDPIMPIMMVRHPFGTSGGVTDAVAPPAHEIKLPAHQSQSPYWSKITAIPTDPTGSATAGLSKLETPNFFDILLQNSCLPTSHACKCLKRYTSTTGCDEQCAKECPCYCKVLCQIRPPPKHVQAVWYVSPPLYQLEKPLPPRLIPRIVHQTWYVNDVCVCLFFQS